MPLNFCGGGKTIAGVVVVVVDVVVMLKIAGTAVTAGGIVVTVNEDEEDIVTTELVVGVGVALSFITLVDTEGGKEGSIRLLAGATMVMWWLVCGCVVVGFCSGRLQSLLKPLNVILLPLL